ncbi:hypothetical protein AGABI2DRAFT_195360 [Agaricus bisporus var. bisporus H97]|uniref:hypothetical protein n=1 Tax=Agaricus bisporus var. bisporus (strain H97 / ATCC MYA-4626 / FGSC 10389) TaxID=936046 RepID=UPI00029F7E90|nr:hypothetical protein AGABI2DRAFT_195360 [Agaricus bisporus var. bisporus H97]EKV43127.1 hypothetical protein AGABI2DRAFT_195360 [Agaricus bisporus var. bisporus H97]
MSHLTNLLLKLARDADFSAASRAPLDTDGAHPNTHAAEATVAQIIDFCTNPPVSLSDSGAYWDLIKNGNSVGMDDRKMLLERLLEAMARLSDQNHGASLKIQQLVIGILYKDLPHPPHGFLSPFDTSKELYLSSRPDAKTSPTMPKDVQYAYRAADGSNYNPFIPGIGKAGSPYARTVPSTNLTPVSTLPDAGLVFDVLLKRDKFTPHPDGISSFFFAMADLIIHCIFNTSREDWTINNASSYLDLSILYGSSDDEIKTVRSFDGRGGLMPDCFADGRLLGMPPASCALLVLLNRNHNYIAQRIFDINECGRFQDPSSLSPELKSVQDDEIFHRTRLVNCGYFMNIILGDYVGAILGLVRDGNDWRLDPLMNMRGLEHEVSTRGEGNVCSVEFNLLYRWHTTLSERNVEWLEDELAKFLPPDADPSNVADFKTAARAFQGKSKGLPPSKWTFGGLSRGTSGRFKDSDLAKVIQEATHDVAGAYKARGIPAAMKAIEVMGIIRSRQWGVCSLNEFRKFMGLKPYQSFREWNPDPEIYNAAAALYKNIDRLELHVGLQAEEPKLPGPGAGLCPGFTISRAILSDAVCLTRGDRFLTTDFTPFNLTAWGYQDCQFDKENGSYGGMLTKLLFRTLPDQYPAGSVLAHFPFNIPTKMHDVLAARNDGSLQRYRWPTELDRTNPLPPLKDDYERKVVNDLAAVKQALIVDAAKFVSNVTERKKKVVGSTEGRHITHVKEAILNGNKWAEYFKTKTEYLLKNKTLEGVGSSGLCYVDIVQDVINLLPLYWICEEVAELPLKSASNPWGAWYEQETCDKFADIAQYIYSTFEPVDDFKLQTRSKKYAAEIIQFITETLDSQASTVGRIFEQMKALQKNDDNKVLRSLKDESGDAAHTTVANDIFDAAVPTAALFSKAIVHAVDYFLDDANKQARGEIVNLFSSQRPDSSAQIMGYVREALRLNPIFTGVYQTCLQPIVLQNQRIEANDQVFVDIFRANSSLGSRPNYSRPVHDQGIWSPYQEGMMTPKFFDTVVPAIVGTILSQKGLKRADGESGRLTKFDENWHGTPRRQYLDISGLVTPWPDTMIVQLQVKV